MKSELLQQETKLETSPQANLPPLQPKPTAEQKAIVSAQFATQQVSDAELEKEKMTSLGKLRAAYQRLPQENQRTVSRHYADIESGLEKINPHVLSQRIERVRPILNTLFPSPAVPDAALDALAKKAANVRKRKKTLKHSLAHEPEKKDSILHRDKRLKFETLGLFALESEANPPSNSGATTVNHTASNKLGS